MEEEQIQSQAPVQETSQPQDNRVSFPTVGEQKKSGGAKTLLIIGILVLVGVLGYVIYRSAVNGDKEENVSNPSSYENMVTPAEEATPGSSASPTSSPSASVDKSKIKIQVQNGTGITGEAAYLQTLLKGLDYTNVTVGNSATQDETETQVSFSSSVPASVVTEITTKLNSTYQTVTKTSLVSTAYDIVIITGLRKGATAKPSVSPTATSKATPSASPIATPVN